MRTKRTRPIRGKYWIESPRMAHEGRIISIRMKVSQVQLKDHGPVKSKGKMVTDTGQKMQDAYNETMGEIERGRVDGEEDG